MKMQDRKKFLDKTDLARVMGISQATLWRVLKSNQAKAKEYKLEQCPIHRYYVNGRKYYLADEVESWIKKVAAYGLQKKR